jgi:hypothetical protein
MSENGKLIMTSDPGPKSDEEIADIMYGDSIPQVYGLAMQDSVNRLSDVHGWTEAERDEHVEEVSRALSDARVPVPEAGAFHALFATYAKTPPDDATQQEWYAQSRRLARERYGLEEGNRRLKLAGDFVRARPQFAQALANYGLGNNPDIIMKLIEAPHNMRMTPKPRQSKKGG